jgi:hypothetical protein
MGIDIEKTATLDANNNAATQRRLGNQQRFMSILNQRGKRTASTGSPTQVVLAELTVVEQPIQHKRTPPNKRPSAH